jgi:hypothetical protein
MFTLCFLLFQIRKIRKVKAINHGAKVAYFRCPPNNQVWFWCPLKASGLNDLVYTSIWTIFVDGSSNSKGSGAGIIIKNDDGIVIELSLGLSFAMTNNTAEYEAFLAGLQVAKDMGVKRVKICTDSQLVAS